MKPIRQIITFVDETAVPYGENYEYAVQVMTAYTQRNWGGIGLSKWETWAELPDGEEFQYDYRDQFEAEHGHEGAVKRIVELMDKIDLPEFEQKLKLSGLRGIDGIGGFLAEKDGVTFIRKNGTWEPIKTATSGDVSPECGQCHGSGVHTNSFDMEVECDCVRGEEFTETECEPCSSGWINPKCHYCNGKGVIVTRTKRPWYHNAP